jgi:hypothetical protein
MTSRRAYSAALALILAVAALVLLPAAGLAHSAAQTRVGASAILATARVGDFTPLAAVSQLGEAHAYAAYSQANGLQFDLYVWGGTTLSGPLQRAVDNGLINLFRLLPG